MRNAIASPHRAQPFRLWRQSAAVLVFLLSLCGDPVRSQQDATREGWLVYQDGNRIAGSLVFVDDERGTFESNRFGTVVYSLEEASFESLVPEEEPISIPIESGTAAFEESQEARLPWWIADSWHADGSVRVSDSNGDSETEYQLDLGAKWTRGYSNNEFTLRGNYKSRNGKEDTDNQNARLRLQRDTDTRLFWMGDIYLERDKTYLIDRDYDYLLAKLNSGAGLKFDWGKGHVTRLALLYNYAYVTLLNIPISAHADTHGPSVYFSNDLQLFPRLGFAQWGEFYYWDDGSNGFSNEMEFTYRISESVSLGLRHVYRDSEADLKNNDTNELKVFTRLTF